MKFIKNKTAHNRQANKNGANHIFKFMYRLQNTGRERSSLQSWHSLPVEPSSLLNKMAARLLREEISFSYVLMKEMSKKLTLSLDEKVIERAKRFAKKNETSLSKMIEVYFGILTGEDDRTEIETTPLVESLTGVIELSDDYDYKSACSDYLLAKHR